MAKYISLNDLEAYKLARKLNATAWEIYPPSQSTTALAVGECGKIMLCCGRMFAPTRRKNGTTSLLVGLHENLKYEEKKTMGFQFIESTDSTGANVAEGYGRFHYLDKVKFYYNAKGSLLESRHWFELLQERGFIEADLRRKYLDSYKRLRMVLGALIKSTLKAKENFAIS